MISSTYQYTDNLFGILEGNRRARIEEEKRKTAQLEAELAIKTKAAGVASDNDLKIAAANSSTKMYLILGGALVIIVVVAVYFKFRKK